MLTTLLNDCCCCCCCCNCCCCNQYHRQAISLALVVPGLAYPYWAELWSKIPFVHLSQTWAKAEMWKWYDILNLFCLGIIMWHSINHDLWRMPTVFSCNDNRSIWKEISDIDFSVFFLRHFKIDYRDRQLLSVNYWFNQVEKQSQRCLNDAQMIDLAERTDHTCFIKYISAQILLFLRMIRMLIRRRQLGEDGELVCLILKRKVLLVKNICLNIFF